jgi:hypothetical protein
MYRRVFKCSLFNHKSIQEYDDKVINVRNKLIELERSIDELTVTCVFLNELDDSYQGWKNMWVNSQDIYIKNNRKDLAVPKIEEILIKLMNRETSQKFNSTSISKNDQSQKNKTFAAKKRNESFDNRRNKDDEDDNDKDKKRCFNCNSSNHSAKDCWYVHSEKTNDKFRVKYLTKKSRKTVMNEIKKTQKEWAEKDKNFKKRILSMRVIMIGLEEEKDDQWYHDSTAIVHVTNDLGLFISLDLNADDTEWIETASNEQIVKNGS